MKKLMITLVCISIGVLSFVQFSVHTQAQAEIKVHFEKPDYFGEPNIYYYTDANKNMMSWPGVKMSYESNQWYTYTIRDVASVRVLFNDGRNQMPGANQPGFLINQEAWIRKDGTITYVNPIPPVTPVDIKLVGDNFVNVESTTHIQFEVTYSDGSKKQVQPTWTISDASYALFEQLPEGIRVSGKQEGVATIQVEYEGLTKAYDIIVQPQVKEFVKVFIQTGDVQPNIYYWNVVPKKEMIYWPGVKMKKETNGWYSYELLQTKSTNLIFNYAGKQTADLFVSEGTWWYKDGKFYAQDPDRDVVAPSLQVNPVAGKYNVTSMDVELIAKDDRDTQPLIYYTLDGSEPSDQSSLYQGTTHISQDSEIKAIAIDHSGNISQVYSYAYDLRGDEDIKQLTMVGTTNIEVGGSQNFKVETEFNDGSKVISQAIWEVADSTIASLEMTSEGVKVLALKAGECTITATVNQRKVTKTITVEQAQTSFIKVFLRTAWEKPNVYYWNTNPKVVSVTWPGVAMKKEADGLFSYTFEGAKSTSLIFNYNGQQTTDLQLTTGVWWYKDGQFYDVDPDKDTKAPTLSTTPKHGNIEASSVDVELLASDDRDKNPVIYYSVDGSEPKVGGTIYNGKIRISEDTLIKAIAMDESHNISQVYEFVFHLNTDATAPTIRSSIEPKRYDTPQNVTLLVSDNKDPKPAVYYTLDGSEPKAEASYAYHGESIYLDKSTTIRVLAIDANDNYSLVSLPFGIGALQDKGDPREDTIYFVITTRFYDGDVSNNIHNWDDAQAKNPDSDPAWRGDFEGLIQKLDYIKALGFNAVWITPIVKNASGYDYHGYHAVDFTEIDPRYATKSESAEQSFQKLLDEAHHRGMKIYQDIVLNHTSNFGEENLFPLFDVDTKKTSVDDALTNISNGKLPTNYDVLKPGEQFQARLNAMKNDTYDPTQIYHHEKSLSWESYTVQTGQIAGDCVDLNTENPAVANYLIDAYKRYIDMGVDGFRVDTVKHVSRLSFNNFYNPSFKQAGGDNFFMFGEVATRYRDVWNSGIPAISTPFFTWKDSKSYAWGDTATNMQSVYANWQDNSNVANQPTSNNAFMNGNEYHQPNHSLHSGLDVIDFPMHWSFRNANDAFHMALSGDQYYNDATYNVTYVDSHDYAPDGAPENQRFAGSQATWAENLSLIFTFRGIPTLYYGSEIEFMKGAPIDVGPNAPLSTTGRAYFGDYITGSVNVSDFGQYTNATGAMANTLAHSLSKHIQRLNQIRRAIPALQKGQYSTQDVQGAIAFKRRYTEGNVDSFALVTISGSATFNNIPNGTYVDVVSGQVIDVKANTLTAECSGSGNMRVFVLKNSTHSNLQKIGESGKYLY